MHKAFVYALCEPTSGEIRYIGVTGRPFWRLQAHYLQPSPALKEWIDGMREDGIAPSMKILEEVPSNIALAAEWNWISKHANDEKLLNRFRFAYDASRRERSERFLRVVRMSGHTLKSLGKAVGCSGTTLSAAAQGKRSISMDVARKVKFATKSIWHKYGVEPTLDNWPLLRKC